MLALFLKVPTMYSARNFSSTIHSRSRSILRITVFTVRFRTSLLVTSYKQKYSVNSSTINM